MSAVPICLQFQCVRSSNFSTVPVCPQFQFVYSSSVSAVPICLQFQCVRSSNLSTVPVCPQFPFVRGSKDLLAIFMMWYFLHPAFKFFVTGLKQSLKFYLLGHIMTNRLTELWCYFDRASSLICGNKMPTRCNRCFYCRSYCLLNMFRASLCPSAEGYVSGLQDATASCKPDT